MCGTRNGGCLAESGNSPSELSVTIGGCENIVIIQCCISTSVLKIRLEIVTVTPYSHYGYINTTDKMSLYYHGKIRVDTLV